jgi:hypothetical protein
MCLTLMCLREPITLIVQRAYCACGDAGRHASQLACRTTRCVLVLPASTASTLAALLVPCRPVPTAGVYRMPLVRPVAAAAAGHVWGADRQAQGSTLGPTSAAAGQHRWWQHCTRCPAALRAGAAGSPASPAAAAAVTAMAAARTSAAAAAAAGPSAECGPHHDPATPWASVLC